MKPQESLEIIDEEAQSLFSNLISFHVNPEEACMGLGIRDIREPNVVNVHSYIHMSIPHFLRFAEAVNKQVNLLIEKGVITREPEQ
ncbi:MAG: hypothetical protein KAW12_04980 [Candidatus Aminicenantes bacterium]|nr:hypothetical protein [Candidatus Aminicenantes bacterium]